MSRVLAELLGTSDPLFAIKLEKLERGAGNPGVDVRLTAEIIGKSQQKMRELGLDPRDTTGKELYRALLNLIQRHDQFLARHIGARDAADVQDVLPRILSFVDQLDVPKSTWAVKSSVAKKLMRGHPPKRVMKQLGYRSLDSMLKRESMVELFAAARFLESATWQNIMIKKYKTLTPRDFEVRDVRLVRLEESKWGTPAAEFVRTSRYNITHLKEFGVVVVLPLPIDRLAGMTITTLPLIIHYLNEVRMYGAYFRLQQTKPDFGGIIIRALADDEAHHVDMAGHALHWRTIHQHFSRTVPANAQDLFEPHVQQEDLYWRKAEEVLYRLEPALHFWHDMDYVAVKKGEHVVSFNMIDMAVSYVNNLPYGSHSLARMHDSLRTELFARYMRERSLEHQILQQLQNSSDSTYDSMDLESAFV